jgi:hypothetical protein
MLKSKSLDPVKVDIDTEELLAWCRSRNMPVSSEARAEFTAAKVKEILQPPRPH